MRATPVVGVFGLTMVLASAVLQYVVAAQWRESARQCYRDVDEILARRAPSPVPPVVRPAIVCACAAETDLGLCTVAFVGNDRRVDVRTSDMKPPRDVRCFEDRVDGGMIRVKDVTVRWMSLR